MPELRVWSEARRGADGRLYSVRYLLTSDEVAGLQRAGVIGDVCEIVGMQTAAARVEARFEKEALLYSGGMVQ